MPKRINRPITRETPDRDPIDNETLMIRLEPGHKCLRIWCKNRRKKFSVRFADIYRLAYQAEARAARERLAKRR